MSRAHKATDRSVPLRVGLSARLFHDPPPEFGFRGKTLQYLDQSIAHWLMGRGALAFMVPTIETAAAIQRTAVSMRDYIAELDGLVLQGGADVSPESYGQDPLRPEWRGDRVRDLYEIEMLWECVFQGKPVLGICRGAQLINVAFGGTLYQDIRTQIAGALSHHDAVAYDRNAHEITIEQGSGLSRLYPEAARACVNSLHHQSIDKLGNGLVIEARAEDGVVEAVRWTGSSYVVGLQWHPELRKAEHDWMLDGAPILEEFLEHAEESRRR